MAHLLMGAVAAYLSYRAARRVGTAYSGAKQEMYERQYGNYSNPNSYYNQGYYENSYPNNYQPSGRQVAYSSAGGRSHHSGRSYRRGY
ncbi:unnamed protein product [Rotaria magnacalcarata]|uniref:Uncharacterized protein n=3 Tax=Rotaria magnacalcarata TaxID=392030 RepID=A0A820GYD3_9BILA|nr:unnamed protein product [Rotaria magnacalcarata]CAF2148521.1 unnamed protein product [Rotaria magnacalcarata]CAF2178551.1 unnamed protein product [Rotaria magnacalcarata]CAF4006024.1 unnamed protein product [Rotaria magnacalcarata]CAF4282661.1 unnamed protein product [Rotaria magnacalcarata]